MRALIGLLALSLAPVLSAVAQDEDGLNEAAERARAALEAHDADALVAGAGNGVRVQLPGAEPSAPVSKAQGAALVGRYLGDAEEVATAIRATRVVSPGRGYVELIREYRVSGTRESRSQSVLLGYRFESERWVLAELRIARD